MEKEKLKEIAERTRKAVEQINAVNAIIEGVQKVNNNNNIS